MDASAGKSAIVKLQIAYFEAFGAAGLLALQKIIKYAKYHGLITILDAKRGDIASTMRAYAYAAFEVFCADAMTVTPYMGLDVIEPLIHPWLHTDRGVYLVWVTSNEGGNLIQNGTHKSLLNAYRQFVDKNSIKESCGLVLGATRVGSLAPGILASLSSEALLVPGVGAQGGTVNDEFSAILANSGCSIVSVSRGILPSKGVKIDSWDRFIGAIAERISEFAKNLAF